MNLKLEFLRLQCSETHRSLVKRELETLSREIPFDDVQITLSKPHEGSGLVEACVHLAVPGPDIRLRCADYTVEAAWRKLRRLIGESWGRRLRKRLAANQSFRPTHARSPR